MMKKYIITILICITMTLGVIYKLDDLVNILSGLFDNTPAVVLENKNKFAKNDSYEFVQTTNDFVPYNYQDLLNIFYTILDAGYETFTFYCPNEYLDCVKDVEKISNPNNIDILTTLGNYVSPYNNFTTMRIQYDTAGEITLDVSHLYSKEDIVLIGNKIDSIWKEIVTTDMSDEDIIYAFHDYIINHTKYDENYEKELKREKEPTHQSAKANGPLFEGFGICSGYTDVMAIVLDKLGIKNFKVASNTHVWNALYVKDKWVHLDLTWDDPVSENHEVNNLLHKFYLIDTETLEKFDIKDHTFDKSIYLELK